MVWFRCGEMVIGFHSTHVPLSLLALPTPTKKAFLKHVLLVLLATNVAVGAGASGLTLASELEHQEMTLDTSSNNLDIHTVVHGNLNPANILMDSNFVSNLGDFGLDPGHW